MGHAKAGNRGAQKEANMENQRDSSYHVERESSEAIGTCGGRECNILSLARISKEYLCATVTCDDALVSILKNNNNTEWAIDKAFIGITPAFELVDAKV